MQWTKLQQAKFIFQQLLHQDFLNIFNSRSNYDAAVEEEDVTYAEEGGRVELQSDSGDYLEVIADSSDHGPIYCVCTIKNNDGVNSLKKSGGDEDHPEVMDLSTAFEKIPGFALICNS